MLSSEQALAARNSLAAAITVVAGVSFGGAFWGLTADRNSDVISLFFAVQDFPVLLLFVLYFVVLGVVFKNDLAKYPFAALKPHHALRIAWITLLVGCCIIWAGSRLVLRNFGLSID